MLLFRSEEDIENWCRQWKLEQGATLSVERHGGWRKPGMVRIDGSQTGAGKTLMMVEALFAELGLTAPFWDLR